MLISLHNIHTIPEGLLLNSGDVVPAGQPSLSVGLGIGSVNHFLDISSSSKGLLRAGKNDASNGRILFNFAKQFVQFDEKIYTKSIQSLGSVKGDKTNILFLFKEDVLVVGFYN